LESRRQAKPACSIQNLRFWRLLGQARFQFQIKIEAIVSELELFGFQIKCSILFGGPQAGKARPLLTKPTVLAPAWAGAIPIPDKN
jgi:hypothetical protein